MKIVELNSVNRGSTGVIMRGITCVARSLGHEVLVCYPSSRGNMKQYQKGDYLIGNRYLRNLCRIISERFKAEYIIHIFSTIFFILRLKRFSPDIIHIHNIHDTFINLPLFIWYVKRNKINIVWTLHDSWLYTGHCTYYVESRCNKWKTQCRECKSYKEYPCSLYDDSKYKFNLKKKLLLSLDDKLSLVPVSSWLAGEISQSFLRQVHCNVVPNGIDMNVFSPINDDNIREKYGIPSGKIILGAATNWGKRKGLSDYYKMAEMLSDEEHIVLVGISPNIAKDFPKGMVAVERTDNKKDMAQLYSMADVVLSLSYAETFGLTIIEANACGTPVVIYGNTAQTELIGQDNGYIVETGNVREAYEAIQKVYKTDQDKWERTCRAHVQNTYSENVVYKNYIDLFNNLLTKR